MTEINNRVKKIVKIEETRNPFRLCERYKINVLFSPLIDMRGYCLYEENQAIINISDELKDHVCDYVCAHELGHLLLHRGVNRIFMDSYTNMIVNKYENEADRFACQLLYTEPLLFGESVLTDWQMADCLNIPICNLDAKLLEMGIYY